MPPTTALFSDSAEDIVGAIEKQFDLDADALTGMTKAFLEEVGEGLGKYGHPLAMMCVPPRFLIWGLG